MSTAAPSELRTFVTRLDSLAERRLASNPHSEGASTRARQLIDHLRGHVRVRAASLDAPLVVLLLGPTGAGKSTIFNTIAGRDASQTGVLRPTTRVAVVLVHPEDRDALLSGSLASVRVDQIQLVEDDAIAPGLVLVDAPDIDSVEHANRELADKLAEAADLCLFVTTATRYADQVPWTVLERVRERGLPLMVVVNRMPDDVADVEAVRGDVVRLLGDAGLGSAAEPEADREDGAESAESAKGPGNETDLQVITVREGALDAGSEQLNPAAIQPVMDEIGRLRQDRQARLDLAARALAGSLAGLGDSLDRIADDVEHEAIDVETLRRTAVQAYAHGFTGLRQEIGSGAFLREEALRHWQSFVGADQITRFFSDGIGRVRGAIAAVFRPVSAPLAEVRTATTDDLIAVARSGAAEAARRTATDWSQDPGASAIVGQDASLWGTSPRFDDRLRVRLDDWIDGIATDIQEHGRPKRLMARGASIGVNVLGTGVMLGTFLHTGGLTGTEIGVAAGTAFVNQKLLSALFGEAAMAELVGNARRRLDEALATTFAEEQDRFERLIPAAGELAGLGAELRSAASDVRTVTTRPDW